MGTTPAKSGGAITQVKLCTASIQHVLPPRLESLLCARVVVLCRTACHVTRCGEVCYWPAV